MIELAIDFLMSKLARSVGTRAVGPQAPVEYDIPEEVVAEGIVNAVAHRDYISNASVEVQLFPDRLEIWNPGILHPPLTLEKLELSALPATNWRCRMDLLVDWDIWVKYVHSKSPSCMTCSQTRSASPPY